MDDMTTKTEDTTISIKKFTRERLAKSMRYGQTYDIYINELMESKGILCTATIQRLEAYKDSGNETIDELVNIVINELDSKINDASKDN